jgi:hypothetical protein
MKIDFQKISIIVVIIVISILSIYIWKNVSIAQEIPPEVGKPYIPFTSSAKIMCSDEKVSCDPNDSSSCRNQCMDPAEMSCVKMNNEYVCLPKKPDINCNKNNGGEYIWTGYGFTQNKDWACLCTRPEIYNGPHCDIKNPSYCSGGKIGNIKENLNTICKCPDNTGLLFRDINTPFCAPDKPEGGGGENGLYGNYFPSPDWRNIFYMTKKGDRNDWAQKIANEFNYGDMQGILDILNNHLDVFHLDQNIINEITKLPGFPTGYKLDPNYRIVVPYTYYENTYLQ